MRILFALNGIDGGATASACDLIDGLRERGHTAVAVAPMSGGSAARRRLEASVEEVCWLNLCWWNRNYRAKWWKRPLLAGLELLRAELVVGNTLRIMSFIRRRGVDLVHTNTALLIEPGFAARAANVPHVWHVREQIGRDRLFKFWIGDPSLVRVFGWFGDAVIANSSASAAIFRPAMLDGRVVVIPNSVKIAAELSSSRRMEIRQRWGVPPGDLVVGMVANLTSRMKGHETFLRAAAQVSARERVTFVVLGKNPLTEGGYASEREYARNLLGLARELGVESSWRLVGFEANIQEVIGATDVVVHPSDQEGFGKVVLEAMAAGIPLI